jgi:NifU-like protein involved in Fe-S cluster formation
MNAPLYNHDILRLAAELPFGERLAAPMASVEKRSPVCGSRVTVDLDLDAEGRVAAVGLLARACALGQASTSLMGAHVLGRTPEELAEARDQLTAWLAGARDAAPDWPGLDLFTPALEHRGRHASIRLAFEAAAEAAAIAATRAAA